MIPRKLEDWTLQAIRDLLGMGMFEPDSFDWKEMLPHKKSADEARQRLRKSCASFANSAGGFLIFGVKDSRGLSVDERLVGIDANYELPRDFGNYPALCYPSVEWKPLLPAIPLMPGRVIHVIEIPKSWKAPHAVKDGEDWHFCKRTNTGAEPMTFEEIRNAFASQAETLRALWALLRTLHHNRQTWLIQKQFLEMQPMQVFRRSKHDGGS